MNAAPSGECFSYSNDASLLLPAHVLGNEYYAMSWPTLGCRQGFVAITATHDDTVVQIKLALRGESLRRGRRHRLGRGGAREDAGRGRAEVLDEDVGGPFCFATQSGDVSGTLVHATEPVQVIAGHGCAHIPTIDAAACDHIEETMLPTGALGTSYLVAYPEAPEGPSPHTLRIAAMQPNTTVTLDPPIIEPTVTGPDQEPIEIRYVDQDVVVHGSGPLLVTHYLHGTEANGDSGPTGDPAESLAVPTEQFRNQYTFLAPDNYAQSYVNVVAPIGTTVSLDGAALDRSAFTPIGDSGYAALRYRLLEGSVHAIEAAQPFGITVYGYGDWTSYMYPGGMKVTYLPAPF